VRAADLRPRSFLIRYLTLFGGEAVSKLAVLAAFAWLARALTPDDYGIVELVLAINVFVLLGVEGGMGAHGARIAATAPERLPALIARVMALRVLVGVPVWLAIATAAALRPTPARTLLVIAGGAALVAPLLLQWVFQGLRQMQWVAAGNALRSVTFAAIVLVVVRQGTDIRWVAAAELAGLVMLGLLSAALVFGRFRMRPDAAGLGGGVREVAGHVWPGGASDLAWACLWWSRALGGGGTGFGVATEVGWVGAAVRLVLGRHTFVWL
jgi:O-antigen/teichoic acid export membrane protein